MTMLEKILATMKERGIKQDALERMCGLSQNRISKWKNEQGEPTAKQLLRIADALRVSLRYLADDSMAQPPMLELDESQRLILLLAEKVGHDLAIQRLMAIPETKKPPTPIESEGGAVVTQRRDDSGGGAKRRSG